MCYQIKYFILILYLSFITGNLIVKDVNKVNLDEHCAKKICITKCCQNGFHAGIDKGLTCVKTIDLTFKPTFSEIKDHYKESDDMKNSDFFLLYNANVTKIFMSNGEENRTNFYSYVDPLNDVFYLNKDGSFILELPDKTFNYKPHSVCVEYGRNEDDTEYELQWYVPDEDIGESDAWIITIFQFISSVFMVLLLIVYSMLPTLRNLQGKMLITYVATQLFDFILQQLQFIFIKTLVLINNTTPCYIFGFIMFISMMSKFYWMSAISYNMWISFKLKRLMRKVRRGTNDRMAKENNRFILYCLYSYGIPILTGIITYILIETVDKSKYPKFVIPIFENCNMSRHEAIYYIYMPMLVILLFNTLFFVLTCYNLWIFIKSNDMELKRIGNKTSRSNNTSIKLYIKLFVVMGISWLIEAMTQFDFWNDNIVMNYVGFINALIGLPIFVIFVCKRDVFRKLASRYSCLRWMAKDAGRDETSSVFRSTYTRKSSYSSSAEDTKVCLNPNAFDK